MDVGKSLSRRRPNYHCEESDDVAINEQGNAVFLSWVNYHRVAIALRDSDVSIEKAGMISLKPIDNPASKTDCHVVRLLAMTGWRGGKER